MALSLSDLLIRRTHVIYETPDAGLPQARAMAALMAEKLGWSEVEQKRQVAEYKHQVALTGHFLGEEFVSIHVGRAGDLFEAAGPMQIPGIDLLENADGYGYDFASPFYPGATYGG
jgi:hypothetical protein